jgi:FMN phosphatase YigB (HAD superfamily)
MSGAIAVAAMLLDLGGVLVDVIPRPGGIAETAAYVHDLLEEEGVSDVPAERVAVDLAAGWRAYGEWKDAQSRRARPREIGHRELWEEFVATDWPAAARDAVGGHASELCERLDVATKDRPAKPTSLDLLRALDRLGIPAALVSNALAGAGSRKLVRAHGFEPFLAAQIYSDEAGVRKPNPEIFRLGAKALGVDVARCWYVGDTYDRDVVGGRRAGVARMILMRAGPSTTQGPLRPDLTVTDPAEVARLLEEIAA